MDKILSYITLCKKAGKLAAGFEEVKHNIYKRGVSLVITTKDLSQKSSDNIGYICEKFGIDKISVGITMETVGRMIGKKAGIIGIKDEGFAAAIKKAFVNDMEDADGNKI